MSDRFLQGFMEDFIRGVSSPISSNVGGAPALTPVLANKVLWLKKGVGVTHVANVVSAWADQSGAGNNLVQATESKKPILQGDNTILFDGVDDCLKSAPFTWSQPLTIYARFKQLTFTDQDVFVEGNTNYAFQLLQKDPTPTILIYANGAGPYAANTGLALGTYKSVAWGRKTNGTDVFIEVSGSAETTGVQSIGNMGGIVIGASTTQTTNHSNMQIVELIGYNVAHTPAERAQTLAYLDSLTP